MDPQGVPKGSKLTVDRFQQEKVHVPDLERRDARNLGLESMEGAAWEQEFHQIRLTCPLFICPNQHTDSGLGVPTPVGNVLDPGPDDLPDQYTVGLAHQDSQRRTSQSESRRRGGSRRKEEESEGEEEGEP